MERSKYFIVWFLFFASVKGFASYQEQIFSAYLTGDMDAWRHVIDRMESIETKNARFTHNLINYQYGFIGYAIGVSDLKTARLYLNLAKNNLQRLEEMNYNSSVIQSYKAAFYGFEIGLNRFRAPLYGPRSIDAAKQAMLLDNTNPIGFKQYAHAQYYMPAIFGGSKTEALEYYHTAEKIYENNLHDAHRDWNYISLLVTIAQAYEELGNTSKAISYYEKILSFAPGFTWVKNELYPSIKNKKKKKIKK